MLPSKNKSDCRFTAIPINSSAVIYGVALRRLVYVLCNATSSAANANFYGLYL